MSLLKHFKNVKENMTQRNFSIRSLNFFHQIIGFVCILDNGNFRALTLLLKSFLKQNSRKILNGSLKWLYLANVMTQIRWRKWDLFINEFAHLNGAKTISVFLFLFLRSYKSGINKTERDQYLICCRESQIELYFLSFKI